MYNFRLSSFSMVMQYNIKLNTESIPFSHKIRRNRNNWQQKKIMKEKNAASANINSCEVLRIE